ncbi:carbohydrate-binding family 9-like protein [Flavivirga eckloniae]|uniref:Carbohydrate-binding domain-containing protein n=1 Tax=Flavivirga eckloniae TaxID=1803846 RepID=A0A2K9PNF1_9FLAO|nr:carbohydrate-binding family 9-like protein [Flavivirga eckloniae]AUP78593.1 hypothetical protein C1H87_07660 [Flavivirga eckloniae]
MKYPSLLLSLIMFACVHSQTNKHHKAYKAKSSITVDGYANEPVWNDAAPLILSNFYDNDTKEEGQQTKAKISWDDSKLFIFFECQDKYLTAREVNRDGMPFLDDCAEVFLIPDPNPLNMHFGFEVNLYKAANDFIFINGMGKAGFVSVKAYNPEIEVEIKVNGTINNNSDIDSGWTMEIAIPISAFHTNGLTNTFNPAQTWRMQLLRQDRNKMKSEQHTTYTLFPLLENRDVHDPQSFGKLLFTQN